MANAYQCDRCKLFQQGTVYMRMVVATRAGEGIERDVCQLCAIAFDRWWKTSDRERMTEIVPNNPDT